MFRTLMFIGIMFMTSSSYSMKIVKKIKKHKKHEKNSYANPILLKEFLIIQKIGTNNNLPQEIINQIQQKNILLNNKHFNEKFLYIDLWKDFHIPIAYHQLLTQTQIDLIENLFESKLYGFLNQQQYTMRYFLNSNQDYKNFLTLPVELRKHLTKIPQSVQNNPKINPYLLPDQIINEKKAIYVYQENKSAQPKLIVPEEKITK